MIRVASRPKRGAILNFKSERAEALNFNAATSAALNFKRAVALNSEPERTAALNFSRASLNFRSRRDEFYRAFLARGSYGAVIASDEILRSRGKNFKAQSGKRRGAKFLKPKFMSEQKEGRDAKYR